MVPLRGGGGDTQGLGSCLDVREGVAVPNTTNG